MQFEPGDIFLLSKVASISPKSLLVNKGLDFVQDKLPPDWAARVESARTLPAELTLKAKSLLPAINKEQLEEGVAPQDLITAMPEGQILEELPPIAKKAEEQTSDEVLTSILKKEVEDTPPEPQKDTYRSKTLNSSDNFYYDDWDIPVGASFTLMPPYVQI